MKTKSLFVALVAMMAGALQLHAQALPSGSDYLHATKIPAKTMYFDYAGTGKKMPQINWGLDLAWISESNLLQGKNYLNIGRNNVSVVRLSFQPCYALKNGALSDDHMVDLNERLSVLGQLGYAPDIYLNSDPKGLDGAAATVDGSYITFRTSWGTTSPNMTTTQITAWVNLMKLTGQYIENNGYTVTSVAPFNEPDFSDWKQGSASHMNSIMTSAKKDSWFAGKRLMGPNTLNADKFSTWWSSIKSNATEGNTHMLSGSHTNYVNAMKTVVNAGKPLCQDELHNVMEAMMGAEYGMSTGIWWGTAEHARAAFCRASDGNGERLAYVEDATAFMAGSVYRNAQDGVTQAFFGASERTARPGSFGLVSKDRDVYYNGEGPTRAFYVNMPADPNGAYQTPLQRNAETVIDIQSGADVQPSALPGDWQVMNTATGKVLTGTPAWSGWDAYSVTLATSGPADTQAWRITALADTIGGDFSYYTIHQTNGQWWNYYLDNKDWSFAEANEMIVYPGGGGAVEQWWFEYAGQGNYRIHNRFSNLVLDSQDGSTVIQSKQDPNSTTQLWRLCNATTPTNLTAPAVPANLQTSSMIAAIKLTWDAVSDADLWGYNILRTEQGRDNWNTIARHVQGTSYLDNTAVQGQSYTYKVQAIDKSCNMSEFSATADAATLAEQGMVAHYEFDGSVRDLTAHQMNASMMDLTFDSENRSGSMDAVFDGSSAYVQLPYQVASSKQMTFASWVYWNGSSANQRIFDLGNGEDEYLCLTPSNGSAVRFEIKANGQTQGLNGTARLATGEWHHVAVTMETGKTVLYVDGTAVASSTTITLTPADVMPVCNFLGRGQSQSTPLFNGRLDDARFYNYALSAAEVATIVASSQVVETPAEWTVGGSYYLYNVEAGQFLCAGNAWGTQASLGTEGIAFTVNAADGGLYSLSQTAASTRYLFQPGGNANEMYVDGAREPLRMVQDTETGFTRISVNPNGEFGTSAQGTTYIGWDGNTNITIVTPLLIEGGHNTPGIDWILMDRSSYERQRANIAAALAARQQVWPIVRSAIASGIECDEVDAYRNPATLPALLEGIGETLQQRLLGGEGASEATPVDLSFLIADADCNDLQNAGWTATGEWASNGTTHIGDGATLTNRFIEKWVNGWNGEVLPNVALTQELRNLPEGNYALALDAVTTNQSSRAEITGASLFATLGGATYSTPCSTLNDVPVCFTTPTFHVGAGDVVTIGYRLEGTNASWVAFDNFRLLYLGNSTLGDVNRDGNITIADLAGLIRLMTGTEDASLDRNAADMDHSGTLTSSDISLMLDILLGK